MLPLHHRAVAKTALNLSIRAVQIKNNRLIEHAAREFGGLTDPHRHQDIKKRNIRLDNPGAQLIRQLNGDLIVREVL